MRRAPAIRLASSPTVVGALTVLITTVAVFLAYNANNGLPFSRTYRIAVELPDANTLVRGNEVRIGGVRVGRVSSVSAEQGADGEPIALAELELNGQVEPLPADSTVLVRPRSAVALKYLEISPGDSDRGLEPGDTLPVSAARPEPVELDQVVNTFDEPTREALLANLTGFGNALAGRGVAINELFATLRTLVEVAQPVAANLAAPETNLAGFWRAVAATASELAPVADLQAELFGNLETTFAALAEVAPQIQSTIEKSPATLAEGQRSLPAIRPFLRHSSEFFVALEPGARALGETSPAIDAALAAGIDVLPSTPKLSDELAPTARALLDFQRAEGVRHGLGLLIDTNTILKPTLGFIAPAQTTCNYLTLLFRNAASIGSIGDGLGTWTRFTTFAPPQGKNSEGSPSAAPANGPEPLNFLHSNPYPNTAAPGQPLECEAGNEIYAFGRQVIGNPQGNSGTRTEGQDEAQLRRGGNG